MKVCRTHNDAQKVDFSLVVNPGFPRGGANLLFDNFFQKTAWKWRNFDPGARPLRSPRSTTAVQASCVEKYTLEQKIFKPVLATTHTEHTDRFRVVQGELPSGLNVSDVHAVFFRRKGKLDLGSAPRTAQCYLTCWYIYMKSCVMHFHQVIFVKQVINIIIM